MAKVKAHGIRISVVALLAATLLLLTAVPGSASTGQWRLISPTEYTTTPGAALHGVFLINGGTSGLGSGNGWAAGDAGLIFNWNGFSWNEASTATTCQLNSVNFGGPLNPLSSVTTSSGWVVGGDDTGAAAPCLGSGTAISLYYNGVSWSTFTVPATGAAEMKGVFLVQSASSPGDSVNAIAVGKDGANGAVWEWNGVPGSGGGWVETLSGAAAVTTSFNSVYISQCTGSSPCSASNGEAVGNGGIIFRMSGGSWSQDSSPTGNDLFGVALSSPNNNQNNGWAVGASCTIIRDLNGVWSGPYSPGGCSATLRSIVLLSSSEGWAVGDADSPGAPPTIVHGTSLDSAPVWTRLPINQVTPEQNLNSVTFATSGGNLWAVGNSGVAAFCQNNCSSQSGAIWSTTTSPLSGTSTQLNSVFMDSGSDGWAVGANPTGGPALIQWNGYSWTQAASVLPIVTSPMFGVYMSGGSDAWAVGGSGTSASTLYWNGNTWQGVTAPACSCVLSAVFMNSGSEAWAVGTATVTPSAIVMHSTTTGGTFTIPPLSNVVPSTTILDSVYFSDSNNGWAGGEDTATGAPIIIHTANDGGDNWGVVFSSGSGLPAGLKGEVTSLFFGDNNDGWAAVYGATSSTILFWNGASWSQIHPITTNIVDFTGIAVDGGCTGNGLGCADGWAVGIDTITSQPVTVHYSGTTWQEVAFSPPLPAGNTGSLLALYLVSSTNGLAVGTAIPVGSSTTLSIVLHLDPPGANGQSNTGTTTNNGGGGGGGGATTTTSTSSTSSTSSSASSSTSTSATSTTSVTTSSSTTPAISTTTSTEVVTPTSSTQEMSSSSSEALATSSSVSTPMALPPIPGFPVESILAGILIGLGALAVIRRRNAWKNA